MLRTDDCATVLEENIRCANQSWTYFPSPDNQAVGFCCLPDWVGYVQLNTSGDQLGVACQTPGYELDTLQSTVPSIKLGSQSTTTAASSATSSTPASTSAEPTSDSVTAGSVSQTITSTPISLSKASPPESSGANIGTIVGITLGVSGVIAGLAGFYWRWRKKHRASSGPGDSRPQESAELAGYYEPGSETKQTSPYEMLASSPPQELDGGIRHELPTEWYAHEAGGVSNIQKEN